MLVVLEIPDEHGKLITYVTATEAPEHFSPILKVTESMVNKWRTRRKITGYQIGRRVYFRLSELQEVEYVLRSGGRGRKRSSD